MKKSTSNCCNQIIMLFSSSMNISKRIKLGMKVIGIHIVIKSNCNAKGVWIFSCNIICFTCIEVLLN